jgi:hypothetical protein
LGFGSHEILLVIIAMADISIQHFYGGRSVFVTGATGFMGKVLVEKTSQILFGYRQNLPVDQN